MLTPDLKAYEQFGVDLPESTNGSGQLITTCPFCGKEKHFYLNAEDGRFQCKVCQAKGNKYSFIRRVYEQSLAATLPLHHQQLSKLRGLPSPAFGEAGIAYHGGLGRYLIPVRNGKGGFVDLCSFNGDGKLYHTAGCSSHLGGLDTLAAGGPVFIAEGPHDATALAYLLRRLKQPLAWSVLWAPGAGCFSNKSVQADCLEHLTDREVYVLFDNDSAGKDGMKVAGRVLSPIALAVYLLAWPPDRFSEGYDIDDLVREATKPYDNALDELYSWCFQYARGADPSEGPPKLQRSSVAEIVKDFESTQVSMYPGLVDALKIALAIVYSIRLGGDPIWLYIIGPPGTGKSLILEATLGSHWCIYRTSVSSKSFVSGFKIKDTKDTSLLSILPGRCLVVKDYSNVISLPQVAKDELVSMLRDAYDGKVIRNYGNRVHREYPPPNSDRSDCRFSFVAGVTKEIHVHGTSGLGERFLKFDISRTGRDDLAAINAALDDSWDAHKRQLYRAASVAAFLSREVNLDKLPTIPEWYTTRLIALIQFVGLCRSKVSRTGGDLDYEPEAESGTRVAKQLKKLSQALCWVLNLPTANQEVYSLVRQVAWDTSHSHRRNLYQRAWELGEFTSQEMSDAAGLSVSATYRNIHDMQALEIVKRVRHIQSDEKGSKSTQVWSLTKRASRLFSSAHLEEIQ
jgi:hypothetical protein